MKKKMALDQFAELSAAVARSLPREMEPSVAQGWIENQAGLAKVLREALMPPQTVSSDKFKTWMTLSLGTGPKTADDFRRALKKGGHHISDWANNILGKPAFIVAKKKTEVELIRVTVADLGFESGATRQDIYERAMKLGFALCPAEVGPQLRLQYKDQPMNEWLLVAMEPITDSDGSLNVFNVARNEDGSWLISNYGKPDDFWLGDNMWAFVRRK